jgi:predicted nucleotidyltransferase
MKKTIQVLNQLQKKGLIKDYAIGGGIATIFYVEPFFTYDLDVFIIPSGTAKEQNLILLSPVYNYLEAKGYKWKGEHIIIEGIPVQFIPANELEEEAITKARKIEYEGVKTRVLTPEHLIALLLRAGRKKDLGKIEKLLEQTRIDRRKLGAILRKYGLSKKFSLL